MPVTEYCSPPIVLDLHGLVPIISIQCAEILTVKAKSLITTVHRAWRNYSVNSALQVIKNLALTKFCLSRVPQRSRQSNSSFAGTKRSTRLCCYQWAGIK